jgi:Bax protein
MQTDANEGWNSPRYTAVCAVFLLITVIIPSFVFTWASGRTMEATAREFILPVLRPATAMAAVSDAPLGVDTAQGDEAKIVQQAFKLDARAALDLFQERDYHIDGVRSGELQVPRLVLSDLPAGIKKLDNSDERKAVFVKTLLPLILLTNEQIDKDRQRLQRLVAQKAAGHGWAVPDKRWLAELAERYGLNADGEINVRALLQRVDVVPVSLALAQAAEESGWGTSRFAEKGNALFGELTWNNEHQGIVPRNRRQGETHRFRAFEDPKASIESYIHNLNTHRAYTQFRQMRAGLRSQGKALDGMQLATALVSYSERGSDYVRTIRSLIRVNMLADFDNAVLRDDEMELVLNPGKNTGTMVEASLHRP